MSETQIKITGSFQANDDEGNQYPVTEYTLFRKTTTAEMALGDGSGNELKEYKLGNNEILRQINKNEFEIESSGTIIRRQDNQ
jgi:hypothetical protein